MTEERLKEIYRDVSHSAHEEMSTDNIHLMAMKQAVNEAIGDIQDHINKEIARIRKEEEYSKKYVEGMSDTRLVMNDFKVK